MEKIDRTPKIVNYTDTYSNPMTSLPVAGADVTVYHENGVFRGRYNWRNELVPFNDPGCVWGWGEIGQCWIYTPNGRTNNMDPLRQTIDRQHVELCKLRQQLAAAESRERALENTVRIFADTGHWHVWRNPETKKPTTYEWVPAFDPIQCAVDALTPAPAGPDLGALAAGVAAGDCAD